jgi:hypothetical protein
MSVTEGLKPRAGLSISIGAGMAPSTARPRGTRWARLRLRAPPSELSLPRQWNAPFCHPPPPFGHGLFHVEDRDLGGVEALEGPGFASVYDRTRICLGQSEAAAHRPAARGRRPGSRGQGGHDRGPHARDSQGHRGRGFGPPLAAVRGLLRGSDDAGCGNDGRRQLIRSGPPHLGRRFPPSGGFTSSALKPTMGHRKQQLLTRTNLCFSSSTSSRSQS